MHVKYLGSVFKGKFGCLWRTHGMRKPTSGCSFPQREGDIDLDIVTLNI